MAPCSVHSPARTTGHRKSTPAILMVFVPWGYPAMPWVAWTRWRDIMRTTDAGRCASGQAAHTAGAACAHGGRKVPPCAAFRAAHPHNGVSGAGEERPDVLHARGKPRTGRNDPDPAGRTPGALNCVILVAAAAVNVLKRVQCLLQAVAGDHGVAGSTHGRAVLR